MCCRLIPSSTPEVRAVRRRVIAVQLDVADGRRRPARPSARPAARVMPLSSIQRTARRSPAATRRCAACDTRAGRAGSPRLGERLLLHGHLRRHQGALLSLWRYSPSAAGCSFGTARSAFDTTSAGLELSAGPWARPKSWGFWRHRICLCRIISTCRGLLILELVLRPLATEWREQSVFVHRPWASGQAQLPGRRHGGSAAGGGAPSFAVSIALSMPSQRRRAAQPDGASSFASMPSQTAAAARTVVHVGDSGRRHARHHARRG